jgi:predicted RecB family nuclease
MPSRTSQLKEIASAAGYRFRTNGLDGWLVAMEYASAAERNRPVPRSLLLYNEDDVRALAHLVTYVEAVARESSKDSNPLRAGSASRHGGDATKRSPNDSLRVMC